MHARLASFRKSTALPLDAPVCTLPWSLDLTPINRLPLLQHRNTLNNFSTDGRSATIGGCRPLPLAGRPLFVAVGHYWNVLATLSMEFSFLLQWRANRGKAVFSSRNVCTATLLIMSQAQKSMALGSQAINLAFSMHDGQTVKLVQSQWMHK